MTQKQMKNNREYRSFNSLENSEHEKENEYKVKGYATTFDKPYPIYEYEGNQYFEVIEKKALDEADLSDVIMQYDHRGKVLARLSNGTLNLDINTLGLKVGADLSGSEAGRELYEEIKNGLITKMSWAFTVAEDSYNRETRTRTISKIKKVYDVSAVSIPANNDTEITARSYFDGVIEGELQELQEHKMALELEKRKFEF